MKINNEQEAECLEVRLGRYTTPIAFKNKVDELIEQGAFNTREEAENWVEATPIWLEIYYEKDCGLFAVESEAVDALCDIYSPYTKEQLQ